MKKLDAEIKLALAEIPENKRKVVSSHDAFGYFSQAYGVHFVSVAGLSSQAEPSAREMAEIIDAVKKEGISGVFVENRSEEHTSELQSLMRSSYAVFCLKKKKKYKTK